MRSKFKRSVISERSAKRRRRIGHERRLAACPVDQRIAIPRPDRVSSSRSSVDGEFVAFPTLSDLELEESELDMIVSRFAKNKSR